MRRTTAAVVVVALTLAACGSAEGDDGETLQDFLGMGDDPEARQAQFQQEQRELEEHIAACMADEGFEYVPHEPPSMESAAVHPRDEMDPDEFREEYGYGLTTSPDGAGAMDEVAVAEEASEDPNFLIQEGMDDAERQAYQEALEGEMPEPDHDLDSDEPTMWEPGGCRGEAIEEVRGDQRAVEEELGEELQRLWERVESDPRIVEAEQAWAACIREAGWELSSPRDTFEHLMEQQQRLQPGPEEMEIPPELAELEPGEQPPDDLEIPEPPAPDPHALEELQQEELELAAADHECQLEHLGEQDEETMQPELYAEVFAEHEAEFVAEHRDTLEQLRDG